jgi:hypothetical protein
VTDDDQQLERALSDPEPSANALLQPPPALEGRILASLAASRPPTRGAIARQTTALTMVSWSITLVVFLLAGGPRVLGRPLPLLAGTALGIGAISGVAAWAALGRGKSMLGRARRLLVPIIIGSPAMILTWKLFWSAQFAGAFDAWPTRPGLRCLVLSLALALCPLTAFVVGRRSSEPRRPVLTGFSAGVALGCITSSLTDLWCPVAYLPHVLLGHLLPIVLLGGIGAWSGWQFIAFERAPSPTIKI